MNRREIRHILHTEIPVEQEKLRKTQEGCRLILLEHSKESAEKKQIRISIGNERSGFWTFLSGIFRFYGIRMWGLHGIVLILVFAAGFRFPDTPAVIPFFMPLFVLASIPVFFEGQSFAVAEIEAVTRASGAQIMLAKLILAESADLLCLTVFLGWTWEQGTYDTGLVNLILYAVVPMLTCMSAILWIARTSSRNGMKKGIAACGGLILMAVFTGTRLPWLYRTSAVGVWMAAFVIAATFFAREIVEMVRIWRGGVMYGTVA